MLSFFAKDNNFAKAKLTKIYCFFMSKLVISTLYAEHYSIFDRKRQELMKTFLKFFYSAYICGQSFVSENIIEVNLAKFWSEINVEVT